MSVEQRLRQDLKDALKAQDGGREALAVIRMCLAALKNAQIEHGGSLSPEQEWEVLSREAKQYRESLSEFERAGRTDTAARLKRELEILGRYLPPSLSDDEIRAIVEEAVHDLGATGPGDVGRVMGRVMPRVKGRTEGDRVMKMARSVLG